jgi:hypothetical protein
MQRWYAARPGPSPSAAAAAAALAVLGNRAAVLVVAASLGVSGAIATAHADPPDKNLERCMKDVRCRAAYFRHKPYKNEDFSEEPFDPGTRLELSPDGRKPRPTDGHAAARDDADAAKAAAPRTDEAELRTLLGEDAPPPPRRDGYAARIGLRGAALDGYAAMGVETALTTERIQWRIGLERNRAQTLRRRSATYQGERVDGFELADRWWFHVGFAGAPALLSGRWAWLSLRTWLRAEVGAETVFSQLRRDEPVELLPPETRVSPYFGAGVSFDAGVPLSTWWRQPVVRDIEVGLEVFADFRLTGVSSVVPRSHAWLLGGGGYLAYRL